MTGSSQPSPRFRAMAGVVLVGLCVGAFAAPAIGQSLSLTTGDERWQESSAVALQGQFTCGRSRAKYNLALGKDGLGRLDLTVNGKRVAEEKIQSVRADIASARGFDYVAFDCTDDFYRFSFYGSGKEVGRLIVTSVSGNL